MLLEREAQLAQLHDMSLRATEGRGCIALVGGEAGIGKTSLLETYRNQVKGTDAKLLWGGCDALFTPRPLGPLHDMAPNLSDAIRHHLAEGVQSSQLYSSLLNDLENNRHLTIMVFEDAHWADNATLDLLKYLGRRISILPVLLVISFRNDEIGHDHPLTRVLGELPSSYTTRIDLPVLSKSAVESLGIPSGYTLSDLYNITGGNPFFVTELLGYRHKPGSVIPASIKDAVAARLTTLSDDERHLLEILSVIPGAINLNLLKYLLPANGETLAMACVGRNLLVIDNAESIKFRHELARLANLARLSSTQQKKIHAQVLPAFVAYANDNQQTLPYDRLVHHAAGAFDTQQVLHYAPRAAAAAAAVGAHTEAADHLSTALQFVSEADTNTAAQLYEDWAYEAALSLRIDDEILEARRHAITLWRALNRPEKVGENLRWLSRMHWYRGEASEADHYADEAIRILESTPQSSQHAMAYSLRSQLHMLNDRMEEAIDWGERALALAEKYDDIEVKVHALNNIGTAKIFRGNADGIAMMEQSLELALQLGLHEHAARVYTNLSEYAVEFNQFKLAESVLAKGIAFNTQHDLYAWSHYLMGRLALLRVEQGRLHDALLISEGVLKREDLTLLMRLPALTVLAKVKLRLGQKNAYELLSEALSDANATEEFQYTIPIHLALVELAWLENNVSLAQEQFQILIDIGADAMHVWRRGEALIWAHRLGITLPESFSIDLQEPFKLELNGDFQSAASQWKSLGLPYNAALTLMQVKEGNMLTTAYTEAQETLEEMDARKALNKLKQLAKTHDVTGKIPKTRRGPYKAAKNHPLGLTKREQQILALMTNGASNKEISNTLSRSQRTVEHHVSSILSKLNASSRMEVMLRVHNEPWLLPKDIA